MATGAQMLLKSFTGIDPQELMGQFKGEIEAFRRMAEDFNTRFNRMENRQLAQQAQLDRIESLLMSLLAGKVSENDHEIDGVSGSETDEHDNRHYGKAAE